jgi:3-dehydroquinate dehydratase-1
MNEVCVPIRAKNQSDLQRQIRRIEPFADLIEVWIDQFEPKIEPNQLKKICKKPLLLVNKPINEQGKAPASRQKRVRQLVNFVSIKPKYIDINVNTSQKLLDQLKSSCGKSTQLILSYHNFKKTPPLKTLKKIVQKAIKSGADLAKIAVHANKPEDNLIIFELLGWAKKKKYPMIGHCMGKKGKISRIVAPILGSRIIFVSTDQKTSSAPGQITLEQYRNYQSLISDSI